jgi:hypothetical protein
MSTTSISKLFAVFAFSMIVGSCATSPSDSTSPPMKWHDKLFAWPEEIDYASPERYLAAGPLTALSKDNIARLEAAIPEADRAGKGWAAVLGIHNFMADEGNFKSSAAGGVYIAKRTVDEIFSDGTLTGCHDWGIVLAASLRALGIPAVFADTASLSWAQAYAAGKHGMPYEGHVFIEAWIGGRWVLLNSNSAAALADYEHDNPLYGLKIGTSDLFFVMFKGLDPVDYGIDRSDALQEAMSYGARSIVMKAESCPLPKRMRRIVSIISGEELGIVAGDCAILGTRDSTGRFSDKFRSNFDFINAAAFQNVRETDLSSHETAVCLYDLSDPEIPAYYADFFKDLARPALEPGVYRYTDGRRLRLLIVGRNINQLIELIDGLDRNALKR